MARRTVVTGGVRSGKSTYAEALLADAATVTYVAPGPVPGPDDVEWAERVAAHRRRRPARWTTAETTDVAGAVRAAEGAVLVDCLGTWVTAMLDELSAWDEPETTWQRELGARVTDLVEAWAHSAGPVVAVTNEVGMGVVPGHRSGRMFRDVLGRVNQQVAEVSDDVVLIVAGRALHL